MTHYVEYIKAYEQNITRECAAGSGFNQTTCECSLNLNDVLTSGNIQTDGKKKSGDQWFLILLGPKYPNITLNEAKLVLQLDSPSDIFQKISM